MATRHLIWWRSALGDDGANVVLPEAGLLFEERSLFEANRCLLKQVIEGVLGPGPVQAEPKIGLPMDRIRRLLKDRSSS